MFYIWINQFNTKAEFHKLLCYFWIWFERLVCGLCKFIKNRGTHFLDNFLEVQFPNFIQSPKRFPEFGVEMILDTIIGSDFIL